MKYLVYMELLLIGLLVYGCSQTSPPPDIGGKSPMPTSSCANGQDAIETRLAHQAAEAYRQAQYLSCNVKAVGWAIPPQHITYETQHGPQYELYTKVYNDEKLIYELQTHYEEGLVKVQEKNYLGDQTEEYKVPPEDIDAHKWGIRCNRGIAGCMFGSATVSWLGPKSYLASFLEETIAVSIYIGIREVEGSPCDVVENHRLKGLQETFYLDRESHLLRRWTQDMQGVLRDRIYSQIKLTPPKRLTNKKR